MIRLNSISTSNVQKSKIPRFSRKSFESTKINDEVESSTNWKENVKINELDDNLKKASQKIVTAKSIYSEEDRNGKYWD